MKKTLSLLLAVVMTFALCTSVMAEADVSQPMTVSIFMQADDNPANADEENPVISYWRGLYNLEIDWQKPPQGSEQEQLNMMLGTGDYTDVIDLGFNTENLTTLYEDHVIYDLAPYLEEYMPNYYAFLNAPENADVKSVMFDDEGHLFNIAMVEEMPMQWGGLVYRRDILETMTGGNIAFPSGSSEPATIADWEYMLELMKQYFTAAGLEDHACLIIPSVGYFATGELMAAFGIGGVDYLDNDGKVRYGIAEDQFYTYLTTMRDWYEKGYVYADFASRTQDLFYLPNTALTYGGAAGIWFGLNQQLGTGMSMPEYGLNMNVQPLVAPTGVEGVDKPLGVYLFAGRANNNSGFVITTACDEAKLLRIMSAFDFFFSEEGSCIRTMGLTVDEGAAECETYIKMGVTQGTRLPNSRTWTEEMNASTNNVVDFAADRMPGVRVHYEPRTADLVDGKSYAQIGHDAWTAYGNGNVYPLSVSFTPEETNRYTAISLNLQDYANGMIAKFIIGREELTPETFKAYQDQLKALGLEEYLQIKQAAYDRFIAR